MSSELTAEQIEARKKRTFKKFTYRGLDLEDLLRKTLEEVRDDCSVWHVGYKLALQSGLFAPPALPVYGRC